MLMGRIYQFELRVALRVARHEPRRISRACRRDDIEQAAAAL
jgi:hypothetical protein